MAKTVNFALPLLSPAQAQKHVTVNEALVRLDAVTQTRVIASDLKTPPASAEEGASYIVPANATGPWSGRAGQIAVWSNGGWVYLEPAAGWRGWHIVEAAPLVFDGKDWISGAAAVSPGGALTVEQILEFDQSVEGGAGFETAVAIPKGSLVFGVTGRVLSDLSGSLSSWRIGVSGSDDRYGKGLGKAAGSYLLGLSGSPVAYYADTPLLVSAEAGVFVAGLIRFAVHLLRLSPPRAL